MEALRYTRAERDGAAMYIIVPVSTCRVTGVFPNLASRLVNPLNPSILQLAAPNARQDPQMNLTHERACSLVGMKSTCLARCIDLNSEHKLACRYL